MTPKEKAEELVNKLLESLYNDGSLSFKIILYSKAKECALICVDELMKDNAINEEIVNGGLNFQYWKEVKKEIELL